MTRLNYALPEDVLRKADPSVGTDAFGQSFVSKERTRARIEAVEDKWEQTTGAVFRSTRAGRAGQPEAYEYHELEIPFQHGHGPRQSGMVTVNLDHDNVLPFDSANGDAVEIRFSRSDAWEDITDQEGDRWELINLRDGTLKLYLFPIYDEDGRDGINIHPGGDEVFLRLTYRYGNLGADSRSGGESALGSQLTAGSTGATSVGNAGRLPKGGHPMVIGGTEYVYVSGVDTTNDEITIDTRGLRDTTDADHASGAAVQYVPMDVREAVAAKAAAEILRNDDQLDFTIEGSDPVDIMAKTRELEKEWSETIDDYTESLAIG